ncbi:hypothetical protein A3H09_01195 [Candidatus Falkowbacteria bacterium RIFCSPLOWO2_12_FULL_45_13]|uniref:Ig-like domain-containing protein n=1 Tax=Candidatus Falkowbacteria bacterium RIFCSPLOWO2_12_FULL_45_13 TaxID=1797991 RepID=A0A1F5SWI0_9BACT|nr:MAG: hypothetical protein A3H09_01195 [Candidatus Falkowbacteria bacterium RIFCSPLOWO2_12_FULL_45_13]
MKKILLFFSLAVFVFLLADNARAAVTDVAIPLLPADGKLNYQTTDKRITWTYSGTVAAPRFNISMVTGSVSLPIATQVLCNTPRDGTGCAFLWKVGSLRSGRFVMGTEYHIKVCVVGSTDPLDCSNSANAFKIIPPELTTQWQVLDLFKKAMGNRYANLNSNGKSGAQGVYDCIIKEYAAVPPTTPPTTAPKITKTVVNTALFGGKKIYELTDPADILVWFKGKFKDIAANDPNRVILNNRDKEGIQYAMSNRFTDLCAKDWLTAINGLMRTYKAGVSSFQKTRDNTIRNCNNDYNKRVSCVKDVECKDKRGVRIQDSTLTDIPTTAGITAKNNQYNNSTIRYIEQEQYVNDRDRCIAEAYTTFNRSKTAALNDLIRSKGLSDTGPDAVTETCLITDNRSAWGEW